MNFEHEIISFPQNLPFKVMMNRIGDVQKHWHQSIELIIVTSGSVRILVKDEESLLQSGDLILVNANAIHELHSDDAMMITVQIKLELVKNLPEELYAAYYQCNSTQGHSPAKYGILKHIVARILKLNLEGGRYIDLMNTSLCYQLLYELFAGFADLRKKNTEDSGEQLDRLGKILNILNNEYHKQLTLENIAKRVYVTVPYLSKSFKDSMGVTLSEYLKSIRLFHAVNDLSNPNFSIEAVAAANGFPNTRAFSTAFQEKYGTLPGKWRKAHPVTEHKFAIKDKSVNYFEYDAKLMNSNISDFIRQYFILEAQPSSRMPILSEDLQEIAVGSREIAPLRHHCLYCIGVSRARELLEEKIRAALVKAQQEIGFRYVKLHSLLDDDMMVCAAGSDGALQYNFNKIDEIFDFLLSIRLKPMVQFSFMPRALAKHTNKTIFYDKAITSPPKDYAAWADLITALTRHLIRRYSLHEVKTWPFYVWNEPSSSNKMFGFEDDNLFYKLYETTYAAVKAVSPALLFGGPASFSTYGKNEDWLFRFLSTTNARGVCPDFINIHYYDIDLTDADDNASWDRLYLSPVENSFQLFIRSLKQRLQDEHFDHLPVFLTEWNSTVSHFDPLSDTCFKSSYIVKNLVENYDAFDGMGYWLLSDAHGEFFQSRQQFHGGLGLFTLHNIPKPSYHAYRFLARLGDRLLAKGNGYIATAKNDAYILLLYNYHHYNTAYDKEIGINTTYTERDNVFPTRSNRTMHFDFVQAKGAFLVTQQFVNQEHGSAFDAFVRMGAVEPLTCDALSHLTNAAAPGFLQAKVIASDSLKIDVTLAPFEIRLIEITPVS